MSKIGDVDRYLINPVGKSLAIAGGTIALIGGLTYGADKLGDYIAEGQTPHTTQQIMYNNDTIPDLVTLNSRGDTLNYMVGNSDGTFSILEAPLPE